MSFPPPLPTPAFPYQVLGKIGEGSMGVVYRAIEPVLERPVAIKTLHPQMLADLANGAESRLRFLQEAKAAAALSHPAVTTIYRTGEVEGVPYIAMEWLEGRTLDEVVSTEGPLAPERVVRLAGDLLAALDAAHRAGVVHRDIKPANLVLLDDGRLKVTDFGIARLQGGDLVRTQVGMVLATPRFASPEQLRGEPVDGRSDLFSSAIVLYYLLTGGYPFSGDDFLQVAGAILRDEPLPLFNRLAGPGAPGIPDGLATAVLTALAKTPEARYASAVEMARALADGLAGAHAGSPTVARPAVSRIATLPVPEASSATVVDLPADAALAAATVVRGWPGRDLGTQACRPLLDRLLDRPLHAAAFAGGVCFDTVCLLLADGLILGAIDIATGETADMALAALPNSAATLLHPAPTPGAPLIEVLAALLAPPCIRHEGLDSTFVNLPALGEKLRGESFSGMLRLERPRGWSLVLFCAGETPLTLFSGDWRGTPIDRPWEELTTGLVLKASVLEAHLNPAFLSYRRELKDFGLTVTQGAAGAAGGTGTSGKLSASGSLRAPLPVLLSPRDAAPRASRLRVGDDPAHRLLQWSLGMLPRVFAERDRTARWKYLVEWMADVRQAVLHHDLPRPETTLTDFFDLVTSDADGRVLHVAEWAERATPTCLATFRERAIQAKLARKKGGDVGGAILAARAFDDATLEAYRADQGAGRTSRFSLGVEEAFTGYEGFVRVGPRRGFHLLLVHDTPDGFVPIFPG